MPLERREALLRDAEAHDYVVIEDDYEAETAFEGEPTPALKSLDRCDRVIYVGSLSKSFAPGLRLGYIVASSELARELRGLRRLMLRHPSAFVQRAFALFVSLGHYDALMRRTSQSYRQRAHVLLDSLARHVPELSANPVSGGASCWVQGPPGLDSERLAERARGEGVLIEPGEVFFEPGVDARSRACFRLGYSAINSERIEPGIEALGRALRSL
jgi:GntR family transcriptional regulator/MocR family aminotransferase